MVVILALCENQLYRNQDLADWFGLSYKSFSNAKSKKLEELKGYADFEVKDNGRTVLIKKVYNPIYKKRARDNSIAVENTLTDLEKYIADKPFNPDSFYWHSVMSTTGVRKDNLAKRICVASRTLPCQDIMIVMDRFGLYALNYSNSFSKEFKASDWQTDGISDRILIRCINNETGMQEYLSAFEKEELKMVQVYNEVNIEDKMLDYAQKALSQKIDKEIIRVRIMAAMQLDLVDLMNLAGDYLQIVSSKAIQVYLLNNEEVLGKIADKYIKKAQDIMSTTKNH